MKALLVLGLPIVLLATSATAFAEHQRDEIQVPARPGEIVQAQANVALQRSGEPTATPVGGDREEKYCVYPRGWFPPYVDPWPCTRSPHLVGIRRLTSVCRAGHCVELVDFGRNPSDGLPGRDPQAP